MSSILFDEVSAMPPLLVRITHSKKKLRKWYREFGEDPECLEESFAKSDAIANTLVNGGECVHIVYMNDSLENSAEADAGLLAHEAVHIAQEYFNHIGEYVPSDELRAYVVQGVTTYLVGKHFDWKRKKFEKRG